MLPKVEPEPMTGDTAADRMDENALPPAVSTFAVSVLRDTKTAMIATPMMAVSIETIPVIILSDILILKHERWNRWQSKSL